MAPRSAEVRSVRPALLSLPPCASGPIPVSECVRCVTSIVFTVCVRRWPGLIECWAARTARCRDSGQQRRPCSASYLTVIRLAFCSNHVRPAIQPSSTTEHPAAAESCSASTRPMAATSQPVSGRCTADPAQSAHPCTVTAAPPAHRSAPELHHSISPDWERPAAVRAGHALRARQIKWRRRWQTRTQAARPQGRSAVA